MAEDVGVNASTDLDCGVLRVERLPTKLADTGGGATIALEHDLLSSIFMISCGAQSLHFQGDPDQRALLQQDLAVPGTAANNNLCTPGFCNNTPSFRIINLSHQQTYRAFSRS